MQGLPALQPTHLSENRNESEKEFWKLGQKKIQHLIIMEGWWMKQIQKRKKNGTFASTIYQSTISNVSEKVLI